MLLVDLDDFKTVNDSLGHVAGDELLTMVAARLGECIGERGVVGRLGGDEFAVILTDVDHKTVEATCERIIAAVSRIVVLGGREVGVGASVGIRYTSGAPDLPDELLRDADLALYTAKRQGKARYRVFVPAMHEQAKERLELTTALANAIQRDEFTLAYQPIVDLPSDRLAGAEGLLRWNHPERGEIGPGVFLQMIEESGQIVEIGWYVLRRALRQLAEWRELIEHTDFYLSINVSVRQLKEPDFAEHVLALLDLHRVPGYRLVMEITESLFIDDLVLVQRVMEQIAGSGVRFGLDDFGTGYSSLSQLQRLPLAVVKIDQSFVARLGVEADGRIMVAAIVQLAGALRLQVVAEGVETEMQRAELIALGCHRGQGWLFGRPEPPAAIAERLGELTAALH